MGHLRQISKIHLALRIFSFAVGMGLGNGLRENHSIYWTCGALPKTTSFRTASLSVQNYTNTLGTLSPSALVPFFCEVTCHIARNHNRRGFRLS